MTTTAARLTALESQITRLTDLLEASVTGQHLTAAPIAEAVEARRSNGHKVTCACNFCANAYGTTTKKAAKGKTTRKAARKGKAQPKATPAWLIERGQNKSARRALAAQLRAQGIAPNGPAWEAAKVEAGIR